MHPGADPLLPVVAFPTFRGGKKVCSHPQITRAELGVAAAEPSREAAFLWVPEPAGEPVPNGIRPPWKTSQCISIAGAALGLLWESPVKLI